MLPNRSEKSHSPRSLQEHLSNNAMSEKMRSVYTRLEPYVHPEVGSLAAALRGSDSDWSKGEMRDRRISDHFRVEVAVRHLERKERDVQGPATQALIRIRIVNLSLDLSDFIAWMKRPTCFLGVASTMLSPSPLGFWLSPRGATA